jgi:phage gp36-like protein
MFLSKEELGSTIYDYQVDQITEGNDDLVDMAIAAAVEEIGGYLSGSSLYDVAAIMAATGGSRNALLLAFAKTIAKWHLVELCNADVIYEQAKERYDRAIAWLTKLSKGTVALSSLPVVSIDDEETETDTYGFGSRTKFTHDI